MSFSPLPTIVIVIQSDTAFRKVCQKAAQELGHTVITVSDPNEIAQTIESLAATPTIVLLDIDSDIPSGLSRHMRHHPSTILVALNRHEDAKGVVAMEALGMKHVLIEGHISVINLKHMIQTLTSELY